MPRTKKQSADKKRKLLKEKRRDKKNDAKIKNLENEKQKKSKGRQNPEYIKAEREKQKEKRQDPTYSQKEKQRLAKMRQDTQYIENEKQKKKEKRQNPLYIEIENQKKSDKHKILMSQNKELYEKIKQTKAENQKGKRLNPEFVQQENDINKERMANKRKNNEFNDIPNKRQKTSNAFNKFREAIREGPNTVCSCCKRLWFNSSCNKINRQKLENDLGPNFCNAIFNNGLSESFCQSCQASIRKKEIPKLCASNYNIVFPVPNELKNLSVLEERMVSLRIPFMKITSGGFHKQCSITGQIVNVPLNINTTTDVLPRNVEDTHTIQIKLKRKMEYEHSYIHETVRPAIILKALDYLLDQPLYKEQNVKKSDNWEENIQNYANSQIAIDFKEHSKAKQYDLNSLKEIVDLKDWNFLLTNSPGTSNCDKVIEINEPKITSSLKVLSLSNQDKNEDIQQNLPLCLSNNNFNENMWADENLIDDEEPVNPGGQETLLDNDELENICFAPGENNKPLHLMLDKNAEELSFPTIFCGQKKEFPDNFSYYNEVKIQAQNVDRRFSRTDFLLYMSKKLQLMFVIHAVRMALRKRINQQGEYTAGEILNPNILQELVKNDAGYMFLKQIRNSPAYWKNEKRKLLSMIRQFNIPTIFLTITAAESNWPELIVILVKVLDDKNISEDQAANLPYNEKVRLIRADPITCARYFDHRFRLLFKHLKSDQGPFKENPIEHYYYRVEFQNRGSPHVHALLWLHGAVKYDCNDPESGKICSNFADKYVTCNSELESVKDIISYNIHKHTKSCRREVRGKYICRYGIPYLPMDYTTILEPLESKNENFLKDMKEKYINIMALLNKNKHNNMSFEEFLQTLSLEKKDYLTIIQYNIRKPTMFLKRNPNQCFINHFNEEIFTMQRSNMDIQFILDPYACCKYIVTYVNKSDRGVSELLRDAVNEIKTGNLDLKAQLKKIGGVFLNSSEISAQEAAYHVLGLRIHETCTSNVFINTKPINHRVRMLKSLTKIKLLESTNKDIYEAGIIEHYVQRPDELADVCLADFAAHYVFKANSTNSKNELKLKDNSGVITYKKHANIISYIRYGLQQDPINFYREQLMLFTPWRDEMTQIESVDQKLLYTAFFEIIKANRAKYDLLDSKIVDDALEKAEQREDVIAERILNSLDPEFLPFAVDDPEFDPFNILDEPNDGTLKYTYPTPFQIPDDKYDVMMASLNLKQYEYLNHVLDCVNRQQTFYNIVGGGAGVGKSRLIHAIYQSLLRYYNSIAGNDPDTIKVLLTAPTGKAAFSIEGSTLHAALSLPISRSNEELVSLSHDTANTIFTHLHDLKLIIIDEFSMVGCRTLDHVNKRLQQLFRSKDDFGGISILLFGDLRQLPPVGDKWIFEPLKSNPYHEICGTYLWDKFSFFELTEIMRQKNDKDFALALNHMANGIMALDDIRLIQSRQVTDTENLPENIIHLFRSNNEVNEFNDYKLSTLNTEHTISIAKDIVKGSCNERLKQLFLKYAQGLKISESFGLMINLKLQIGAKYMVSSNIDTQDGIVNGATGILMRLEYDDNQIAKRCWLEFFDSRTGNAARRKHATYMKNNNIPETLTPIERCAKAFQVKKGSNIMVERSQFPLRISEGITIHKSQGATYEQVAVHLKKGISRNAIYVACSRATSLKGLYIFGDFEPPKKPTEKDRGFCELKNLQNNKCLQSAFNLQYQDTKSEKLIIIYQNVQSLIKHFKVINNNPLFINADILIFVETWLKTTDVIEFDNFECFAKICQGVNERRKPYGISCYKKKDNIFCTNISTFIKTNANNITFQAIIFSCNNIYIIVVYIPPKFAIQEALNCLKQIVINDKPTIIVGDFNQDLSLGNTNCLQQFLKSRQFTSKVDTNQPTTNAKTHIDWCFSNVDKVKAHIYTTVYSHHKAISFNLYQTNVTNLNFLNQPQPIKSQNKIHIKLDDNSENIQMSSVLASYSNNSVKILSEKNDSSMVVDDFENMSVYSSTPVTDNFKKFGLYNTDQVSCYANVTVQCLFSIVQFRRCIENYNNPPITDEDKIKKALHKIITQQVRNCLELRPLVGDEYAAREQQDAHLFLLALLNKLRDEIFLRNIRFSYVPDFTQCTICNEIGGHEMHDALSLTLYFPANSPETINFNTMFSPRQADIRCSICNNNNLTTRPKLLDASEYLIICLQRTKYVNNQYSKIMTKFENFDENLIILDAIVFQVKAVIKHLSIDPNINSGHYIAHVRYNNEWWEFNDSSFKKTRFDRSLENVTVMLLER